MEKISKPGLSGAALKWMALVSMLLDHTGLAFVWYGLIVHTRAYGDATVVGVYYFLRGIGRLAFPLYCFLIGEGFRHTRSTPRYIGRLFLFALLSEIPFDLAFNRALFELGDQNVFFTLALGLLAIMAWERCTEGKSFLRYLLALFCAAAAMTAAWALQTDYGALGVLLILVMYVLREREALQALAVTAVLGLMVLLAHSLWIELFGVLALVPLHFYNGERGRQPKLLFYILYPAHLLFLVLLRGILWGF